MSALARRVRLAPQQQLRAASLSSLADCRPISRRGELSVRWRAPPAPTAAPAGWQPQYAAKNAAKRKGRLGAIEA